MIILTPRSSRPFYACVAVIRTDTLYGLVARAADPAAVRRVYALKNRSLDKAVLLLVDGVASLYDQPSPAALSLFAAVWPGPVSIIIASPSAPEWLPRVEETLAFRQPDAVGLRELIRLTGSLIAPSANLEGRPPAVDVAEAKAYFGDRVDLYVDGGRVEDPRPSRLIRVHPDGTQVILR